MSIYDDAINLIESEDFVIRPNSITCFLKVGDSDFVGTSHLFSNKFVDINKGKESAKKKAIDAIIEAECYHLKRVRNHLSERIGLRFFPSYAFAIGNYINVNVTSIEEKSAKEQDGVFRPTHNTLTLSFYMVGQDLATVKVDYKNQEDLNGKLDSIIEEQVRKMVALAS